MKRDIVIIAISLLTCFLGLSACKQGSDPVMYSYPETALSDAFRIRHITKTVYVPGKMKLYYKGANLQGAPVRCFDANFEDLGGEFEPVFEKGVLTIQVDFAERISGLEIEDRDYDVIYRLRYLDSPQFAWLADLFWYDYGWMKTGDTERYYSEDELEAQAKAKQSAKTWESQRHFALLEGAWISRDGLRKWVFSLDPDGTKLIVEELWFDDPKQKWSCSRRMIAKSAYEESTPSMYQKIYMDETGKEIPNPIEIQLVGDGSSAEKMEILYDRRNPSSGEQVILVGASTYLRTAPQQ